MGYKTVYIYGLTEPDNLSEIRYIGKTTDIKRRYRNHLRKTSIKSKKQDWINSLVKDGKKPNLIIIHKCYEWEWAEFEIYYIKTYRELGYNLLNITDGGDSPSHAKETIEKIRKSNTGKHPTKETIQKLILSHIGIKQSPQSIEKIRLNRLGSKQSPETCRKISLSRQGDCHPHKGNRTPLKPSEETTKFKDGQSKIMKDIWKQDSFKEKRKISILSSWSKRQQKNNYFKIDCPSCHKNIKHYAKGLCQPCYKQGLYEQSKLMEKVG
jgi:hypothetical protein